MRVIGIAGVPRQHADQLRAAHEAAHLRWLIPLAFLGIVGWLVWRGVDEFDLPELQRTLLDVPTLPALGVALLALVSVAFTGLIDVVIARWLDPSHGGINLGFPQN